MKHSIHEYKPRYSQTFDCEEWVQLLIDTGVHKKNTLKLDGKVKSIRFDSPNGYFHVLIHDNQLIIKVPDDESRSATLFAGGTSFRYVESKIEQLLLRDVIGS